ncbi:MAG: gamma-glutamyl-gamma-aminobutyrate hydrolase family protein [Acidobacteria bacterium]|nr:gamma-glutamyl-gamma-aminobutyrate hydrolase family protein [Acidobacteriota bacterium]
MPTRIAVSHLRRPNDYFEAVDKTGAVTIVADWTECDAALLLDGVDGLLLTGGRDVDPGYYGQAPHPTYQRAEAGRDDFEIELARLALERDLPVLGICRGMQLLNVVCGGTLWQDLPSELTGTPLDHKVSTPLDAVAHDVAFDGETRIGRILARAPGARDGRVPVNSRHHQAVKHLAPGWTVAGTAPDGVIEAMERPDSRFCLAVQWHPENFWRTGEFDVLFDALVAACAEAASRRRG